MPAKRILLDEVPATRAAIFRLLKKETFVSIHRIAEALGVSHEAARVSSSPTFNSGERPDICSTTVSMLREKEPPRTRARG